MSETDFNSMYSQYYPIEYARKIVGALKYDLPFHAMAKFKREQKKLFSNDQLQVTFVGSGHGLDVVAFKSDLGPGELLERWSNDASVMQPFPKQSEYEVSMVDIEAEPLKFASDIGLCDKSFIADMRQPYSPHLERHLNTMTDIVICVGATGYIGVSGIEKIIHAAFVNGKAKLFCFSVVKHLDANAYIQVCLKHGLTVKMIGNNFRQRNHKSDIEKQKVHSLLKQKNLLTLNDEQTIRCDVFMVSKPDILPNNNEVSNAK